MRLDLVKDWFSKWGKWGKFSKWGLFSKNNLRNTEK